jgi:mono/diheme cytochrome c family protein
VLFRTALILLFFVLPLAAEPGLAVRFESLPSNTSAQRSSHSVLPFAAFHVPPGASPAFGLPAGSFTAEITGYLSVDLRAQHSFALELTGEATVSVNGKELLRTAPASAETNFTSAPIRLSKGTNSLQIRYISPKNAPATFRLLWSSRNSAVPVPIPAQALSHSPTVELTRALTIQNGAYIFQQYQCSQCHTAADQQPQRFGSPDFSGIGSRLRADWIVSWLTDPAKERHARMPSLLRGADSAEQARAIAAYLSTLTTNLPTANFPSESPAISAGAAQVSDLHCASCHTLPSEPPAPDRIRLDHLPRKFVPEALVQYLAKPRAHYPSNPMPDFHLSRAEAEAIAGFLLQNQTPHNASIFPETLAAVGKELVQKEGCLNCHSLDLPNEYNAPAFAELSAPASGCLDPNHPTAPQFALSEVQRADLRAFLESKNISYSLPPADLALRSVEFLRCDQCHTANNLPAPLTLGGKLKPEWTAHFIAGEIAQKPRPWLKARMPSFPAHATSLAVGLAALHGQPPRADNESAPAPSLVKTGETLISANGGFSCVACHAVGANNNQLVVESPGVNLADSGDRLLPSYFRRWLMNPIAIDPGTKMPAYFDAEGRSQLVEFFDGDAHALIDAMWHYIRSLSRAKSSSAK